MLQYKKDIYLYIFNNCLYSIEATSEEQAISRLVYKKFGTSNRYESCKARFKANLRITDILFVEKGELCDNKHNRDIWDECWMSHLEDKKKKEDDICQY